MKIIESILTKNPCYKQGRKITVKGLMLHSVGCNQPDASVFARGWNKASQKSCVHAFIDGNTGEVYQTLPWNHRGWHAGGTANNTHIGVEMCEPACIKYKGGAAFTCHNIPVAKAVVERTYNSAVELFAYLCKEYNLDPLADGVIISHKEGSKRKIASGHVDPEHIWDKLKTGYTMDGFRKAVKAAMNGETVKNDPAPAKPESKPTTEEKAPAPAPKPEATAKTLYRVQVGAFSVKKYAEARAEKLKAAGFDAFIAVTDGKLYRVQTGAFADKANATKHLAAVKKAGFAGFVTTLGN